MSGAEQMPSAEAIDLLQELALIPACVGYDKRVKELDEARLIEWDSETFHGYKPTLQGLAVLAQVIS